MAATITPTDYATIADNSSTFAARYNAFTKTKIVRTSKTKNDDDFERELSATDIGKKLSSSFVKNRFEGEQASKADKLAYERLLGIIAANLSERIGLDIDQIDKIKTEFNLQQFNVLAFTNARRELDIVACCRAMSREIVLTMDAVTRRTLLYKFDMKRRKQVEIAPRRYENGLTPSLHPGSSINGFNNASEYSNLYRKATKVIDRNAGLQGFNKNDDRFKFGSNRHETKDWIKKQNIRRGVAPIRDVDKVYVDTDKLIETDPMKLMDMPYENVAMVAVKYDVDVDGVFTDRADLIARIYKRVAISNRNSKRTSSSLFSAANRQRNKDVRQIRGIRKKLDKLDKKGTFWFGNNINKTLAAKNKVINKKKAAAFRNALATSRNDLANDGSEMMTGESGSGGGFATIPIKGNRLRLNAIDRALPVFVMNDYVTAYNRDDAKLRREREEMGEYNTEYHKVTGIFNRKSRYEDWTTTKYYKRLLSIKNDYAELEYLINFHSIPINTALINNANVDELYRYVSNYAQNLYRDYNKAKPGSTFKKHALARLEALAETENADSVLSGPASSHHRRYESNVVFNKDAPVTTGSTASSTYTPITPTTASGATQPSPTTTTGSETTGAPGSTTGGSTTATRPVKTPPVSTTTPGGAATGVGPGTTKTSGATSSGKTKSPGMTQAERQKKTAEQKVETAERAEKINKLKARWESERFDINAAQYKNNQAAAKKYNYTKKTKMERYNSDITAGRFKTAVRWAGGIRELDKDIQRVAAENTDIKSLGAYKKLLKNLIDRCSIPGFGTIKDLVFIWKQVYVLTHTASDSAKSISDRFTNAVYLCICPDPKERHAIESSYDMNHQSMTTVQILDMKFRFGTGTDNDADIKQKLGNSSCQAGTSTQRVLKGMAGGMFDSILGDIDKTSNRLGKHSNFIKQSKKYFTKQAKNEYSSATKKNNNDTKNKLSKGERAYDEELAALLDSKKKKKTVGFDMNNKSLFAGSMLGIGAGAGAGALAGGLLGTGAGKGAKDGALYGGIGGIGGAIAGKLGKVNPIAGAVAGGVTAIAGSVTALATSLSEEAKAEISKTANSVSDAWKEKNYAKAVGNSFKTAGVALKNTFANAETWKNAAPKLAGLGAGILGGLTGGLLGSKKGAQNNNAIIQANKANAASNQEIAVASMDAQQSAFSSASKSKIETAPAMPVIIVNPNPLAVAIANQNFTMPTDSSDASGASLGGSLGVGRTKSSKAGIGGAIAGAFGAAGSIAGAVSSSVTASKISKVSSAAEGCLVYLQSTYMAERLFSMDTTMSTIKSILSAFVVDSGTNKFELKTLPVSLMDKANKDMIATSSVDEMTQALGITLAAMGQGVTVINNSSAGKVGGVPTDDIGWQNS